jgi:hypothetical protein
MITKIKSKLGIGKSPASAKDVAGIKVAERKDSSKSSTIDSSETPRAIEVSVGKPSTFHARPVINRELSNTGRSFPQVPAPVIATANTVESDEMVVTRERVGRVSNRLSKRAEMMKQQNEQNRTLVSHSLRTLESIASTGSQAEFFHPRQSIVIFDWDDTLCPSHWIRINRPKLQYFQPCPDDPRYKLPLESLSDQVIKVLRASSAIAKTIILTNAQVTWVEISCKNFMPRVWPVIQELGIDIVYARQSVEQDVATSRELDYNYNANAPQLWKERAMKDNISKFYSQYLHQSWKNIVSIGDQICEHNALRIVSVARPSGKKKCRTKTVKLIEEPTVENLVAENQVIIQWLNGLVQYDGALNVDLSNDDDVLLDLHDLLARK